MCVLGNEIITSRNIGGKTSQMFKFVLCNIVMAQKCKNEQLYGQDKICRELRNQLYEYCSFLKSFLFYSRNAANVFRHTPIQMVISKKRCGQCS